MKYALFNEFDKVFLKYIRTNLSKHAMEKKEREENKKKCPLPSAPDLALGKAL